MTNTEAQIVIANMMMRGGLSDVELDALIKSGEALEDDWISVDTMLPPILDEEKQTSDKVQVAGVYIGADEKMKAWVDVGDFDYRQKGWWIDGGFYKGIRYWKYLSKPPIPKAQDYY